MANPVIEPVIDQKLDIEDAILTFTFFVLSIIYLFEYIILAFYNESKNPKEIFNQIVLKWINTNVLPLTKLENCLHP